LRENVFLSIHPQIGESLLGGVKDLSEITERSFVVQHLVCLGELIAILPAGTLSLEGFTESFYFLEELLASSLALVGIEVVPLIMSLLEMVTHHDSIFQEEEVRASAELLDFSERAGRRSGSSHGDEFGKAELVFFADVLTVLGVLAIEFAEDIKKTTYFSELSSSLSSPSEPYCC
jgi:hypothetical protein